MNITDFPIKKAPAQTYSFNSYDGEEIRYHSVSGDMECTLMFGGLEFVVTYDIEHPGDYRVEIAGQVPSTTELRDCFNTCLYQAIGEAQQSLLNQLIEESCEVELVS